MENNMAIVWLMLFHFFFLIMQREHYVYATKGSIHF